MKRPALKSPRHVVDPAARACIADLNESIEQLRGAKIERLDPATATTAQLAQKLNEVLELLQG